MDNVIFVPRQFLSTLSLRRATIVYGFCTACVPISIHALLAESDKRTSGQLGKDVISIHALLAESDILSSQCHPNILQFLSTLSLRRATVFYIVCGVVDFISIHALLAESDALLACYFTSFNLFLSTLSLRRATSNNESTQIGDSISIHALLAESDSSS